MLEKYWLEQGTRVTNSIKRISILLYYIHFEQSVLSFALYSCVKKYYMVTIKYGIFVFILQHTWGIYYT